MQDTSFVLPGASATFILQESEPTGCRRWYCAHPAWTLPILFLSIAGQAGPGVVLQSLGNEFYGTQAQVILYVPQAIGGLCGFVTVPIIGALSDRYGRKPMLFMSVLATAIPWTLLALFDLARDSERFKVFLVLRAVMGVFGDTTAALGLCFSYMADVVPPERRGPVGGLLMAFGAGAGFIVAPQIFAYIYGEGARLQLTLTFAAAMMLLQAVYVGCIPESNMAQRRATLPPLDYAQLKPSRSFQLLCSETSTNTGLLRCLFVIMFLCYLVKIGLTTSLGIFTIQVYHFTTKDNSNLAMVYGIFQCVSQLVLPFLLRMLSQRSCVLLGILCGLSASLIPAIPGVPGWTLYFWEALLAVPYIVYTVITTIACRVVPPSKTGEASMMVSSALTLSSAIGPLAFGALSSVTVNSSYPGGAFLLFVLAMVAASVIGWGLPSDRSIGHMHEEAKAAATKLPSLSFAA